MKPIGSIEVTTNKRITLPQRMLDALDANVGDILYIYEDKDHEAVVVKKAKDL